MTSSPTAQNIDFLPAILLEDGSWQVSFRSGNEGLCHQLYVNASLVQWTDLPSQRQFFLPPAIALRELAILAVAPEDRSTDFSSLLCRSSWQLRIRFPQLTIYRRDARVAIMDDHATGVTDPAPLLTREIWPASSPRYAFGEDRFGLGGSGFDGACGPGLGKGLLGLGEFGIDAREIELSSVLAEEGLHKLILRVINSDGKASDSAAMSVLAMPPPAPPTSIAPQSYDPDSHILTLQLQ